MNGTPSRSSLKTVTREMEFHVSSARSVCLTSAFFTTTG